MLDNKDIKISAMSKDVKKIFKDLHKIPELSYQEFKTTKYIFDYLNNYDLEIYKLNPTGLIAVYRTNKNKDAIIFRADIDALPIGTKAMHSCGHDAHTSMLLKFISNILEKPLKFDKNLIFVFQPAEEVDGGARIVLESKVFDEFLIKGFFAMHLWPEIKNGIIGIKKNEVMGTNFVFEIDISGVSAHVSTPQKAIDCTQVLGDLIQSVNYLIAKTNSPFEPSVINFGKINGGVAPNIIIDNIIIEGTLRAGSDKALNSLVNSLKKLLNSLELKYGCKITITQKEITYPAVKNDLDLFFKVTESFSKTNDFDYLILDNPSLACEDFGFYTQKYPSLFLFIGTNSDEYQNMLHSKNFCFDEDVLEKGVQLYEGLLAIFG